MGAPRTQIITEVSADSAQEFSNSLNLQGGNVNTAKRMTLQRTPGTAGNQRTWTYSWWWKPGYPDSSPFIGSLSPQSSMIAWYTRRIWVYGETRDGLAGPNFTFAPLYRDFSGFYHFVIAVDTTQPTDTNRVKFWCNGVQVEDYNGSPTHPAQNYQWSWNYTGVNEIGGRGDNDSMWADGSFSNLINVDGVALSASYFGYTDPLTGAWRPKKFIPGGTTVNNGTTWSSGGDNTNINGSYPWTKAFDGITDGSYSNGAGATDGAGWARWTPSGGVVVNYSLRVNTDNGTTSAVKVKFSGAGVQHLTSLTDGWNNVSRDGSILEYIEIYNQSTTWSYLCGVEVDGSIMKDGATQNIDYGTNGFYLPMDGSTPIGEDQSGKGNNWTRKNFFGDLPSEATGPQPIYKTIHGGAVATAGVSTDTAGNYCTFAAPLAGHYKDVSHWVNNATSEKNGVRYTYGSGPAPDVGAANVLYGGSYYFKGDESFTNGGSLGYGDSADFELGSGDYTLEGWACLTGDLGDSDENCIISKYQANGSKREWLMYVFSGDRFRWSWSDNGGSATHIYSATNIIRKWKWYHWAVCKDSTNVRMYVNGIQQADVNTNPGSVYSSDAHMTIGAYYSGSTVGKNGMYRGYQSDIRIYKGTAKYANGVNFTPSSWSGNLVKESPSGVVYGSELVKPTTGGIISDGNGDNLYLAETSDFAFGTGDFTIEGWFYGSERNNDTYPYLFDFRENASSNSVSPALYWNNDETLYYWQNSTAKISWGTNKYVPWKWSHYAVVRISGTTTLYFDGKSVGSYSDSGNYPDARLTIGQRRDTSGQSWPGMYSNFRVVKGTGVYTANFVPPTTPLTNITNTKLLCCQSSTSVTEAAVTPGTITANGDLRATTFNPLDDNVGVARGMESNYCTWNQNYKRAGAFIFDSNCAFWHYETYGWKSCVGNIAVGGSGKWYFEVIPNLDCPTSDTAMVSIGVANVEINLTDDISQNADSWMYENDGNKYNQADGSSSYGDTFTSGDIIGVSIDFDNGGVLRFYKNGIDQGAAVSNLNQAGKGWYYPCIGSKTSQYPNEGNWGQKPWHYPPPDGFKAICASNLPSPGLTRPDQYVKANLHTGNGGTNPIVVGWKPDLTIIKVRSETGGWRWNNSVLGAGQMLASDSQDDVYDDGPSGDDMFPSFNHDGFTVKGTGASYNKDTATYVSYNFKAGGNKGTFNVDGKGYSTAAAAGLSGGAIDPSGASVGTKQGFGIYKWSGTGSAGRMDHGLGAVPKFHITKSTNTNSTNWYCYHTGDGRNSYVGKNHYIALNGSSAAQVSAIWGYEEPTSTDIYFHTSPLNVSGQDYITYAWADVEGVQRFGMYKATGVDGESAANFVYLGFRPAIVWIKALGSYSPGDWFIHDNKREPYNPTIGDLRINTNGSESGSYDIDFHSNGFHLENNGNGENGSSGNNYLYCAWAEAPFHNLYGAQSNAR